ncbi:TfuA-like protein [Streptomyces lasalocidi]
MTPRRIAFVGPTLPERQRPAGPFVYLPPVKHGDLFDLCLRPGDQVLIVDGVYQHFAPIRHKEILAQLARGVHVAGTASLGALRAAELDGFGMQGLGQVYAEARAGRLVADADVAVLHADDSAGARRLTEAMVSVRHGLAELVGARRLDPGRAARLEQAAARLHFTERSATGLRHAAGPDRDAMQLLLDHLEQHGDIKTRDARHALDALAAHPVPPPPPAPAAPTPGPAPTAGNGTSSTSRSSRAPPSAPGSPWPACSCSPWTSPSGISPTACAWPPPPPAAPARPAGSSARPGSPPLPGPTPSWPGPPRPPRAGAPTNGCSPAPSGCRRAVSSTRSCPPKRSPAAPWTNWRSAA